MAALTTPIWIEKAKLKHGDRYDYSKVEYVKAIKPIVITCRTHGDFIQSPNSHLNGRGCPCCGRIKLIETLKSNTCEFIEKSKKIHGDKYDYSKVVYTRTYKKITISCHVHGDFTQTARDHLVGKGCEKCKLDLFRELFKSNTCEFIEKSKKIHGDKYDYSKVVYTNAQTKVIIICPEHGEFEQTPRAHINQHKGCSSCAEYGYRKNNPANLYIQKLLKNNELYAIKFGITNNKVEKRIAQQNNKSIFKHELFEELYFEDGSIPLAIENEIKKQLKGQTSYVSKEDMKDGFTETVAPELFSKIMHIVKTFKK